MYVTEAKRRYAEQAEGEIKSRISIIKEQEESVDYLKERIAKTKVSIEQGTEMLNEIVNGYNLWRKEQGLPPFELVE